MHWVSLGIKGQIFLDKIIKTNYKEDTTQALPFFRISISLLAVLHIMLLKNDLHFFYYEKSLIPHELSYLYYPNFFSIESLQSLFAKYFDSSFNDIIDVIINLYIISCVLLCIGLFCRFAAMIALLSQLLLIKSASLFSYGVDCFTTMSLFYCLIFPVGKSFGLGVTLKKRRNSYPVIFKNILKLHLCIAYFFSGLGKALGINWWNGESIWKTVNLPYINSDFQINLTWLSKFPLLLTALGIFVVFLELFYPILVYRNRSWIYATICMHLSIAIILNLYFFSAIMIIWNITAFYFEMPVAKSARLNAGKKTKINVLS